MEIPIFVIFYDGVSFWTIQSFINAEFYNKNFKLFIIIFFYVIKNGLLYNFYSSLQLKGWIFIEVVKFSA